MAFSLGRNRLAIGDRRQLRDDLEVVTVLDLLQHGREVQLAEAAQNDFIERHDVLDQQRGILSLGDMQRIGDLLRILVVLSANGQAEHRARQLDGFQVEVILVMRVVEHGVVVRLIDTCHR